MLIILLLIICINIKEINTISLQHYVAGTNAKWQSCRGGQGLLIALYIVVKSGLSIWKCSENLLLHEFHVLNSTRGNRFLSIQCQNSILFTRRYSLGNVGMIVMNFGFIYEKVQQFPTNFKGNLKWLRWTFIQSLLEKHLKQIPLLYTLSYGWHWKNVFYLHNCFSKTAFYLHSYIRSLCFRLIFALLQLELSLIWINLLI